MNKLANYLSTLQRQPDRLTALVTAVTRDDQTGRQQRATVSVNGNSMGLALDFGAPDLAPGDYVRLENHGSATLADWRLTGVTGARPLAGLLQFTDQTVVGGFSYGPGDIVLGGTYGDTPNWWYDYSAGVWFRRLGQRILGFDEASGKSVWGPPEGVHWQIDPTTNVMAVYNNTRELYAFDGDTGYIRGWQGLGRPLGPGIRWGEIEELDSDGDPVLDVSGNPLLRYAWRVIGLNGVPVVSILSGDQNSPDEAELYLGAPGAANRLVWANGEIAITASGATTLSNVAGLTLTNSTPSRLLATDGTSAVVSVGNLASWIAGTAPITATDDGDGTVTLAHAATAGYVHLPAAGSANQILKNSGVAGTGAWGTVTENVGALAAVTTLAMSGQLTSTLATGTAPLIVASTTLVSNFNAQYLNGIASTGYAQLAAANTFTAGPQTVQINADANKGLIIQGYSATQSADLQQWQDSASVVWSGVNKIGAWYWGNDNAANYVSALAVRGTLPTINNRYYMSLDFEPTIVVPSAYYSAYTIYAMPTVTINAAPFTGIASGCTALTVTAGTVSYRAFSATQPSTLTGTLATAYGLLIGDFNKATTNYAIYTGAGLNRLGDQLAIVGATDRQQLIITGFSTQAIATPVAQITRTDAAAGISAMLGLTALGSGAANDGGSILLNGKSSTAAAQSMGLLTWSWIVATHASRTTRITLSGYDYGGAREGLRIDTDGAQALLGFYAHAAVAQQVLATGAGATVDNVITALQALGLVKQS